MNDSNYRQPSRNEGLPYSGRILTTCILILVAYSGTWPYNHIAMMWPIIGLIWLWEKLGRDARKYQSDRWTEYAFALKTSDACIMAIFGWPLDMLVTLTNWGPTSFRELLEHEILDYKLWEIAPTHGRDSAIFAARDIFSLRTQRAIKEGERLKKLPDEVALGAKTGCAYGSAMMTLASAPVMAAEKPSTNEQRLDITAYGWVSGVAQRPIGNSTTASTNDLRFARIRTILTDTQSKTVVFTEVDMAPLQHPGHDWAKQYFVSLKPTETLTLSVGRMAVSPVWMIPPPFLLETVNSPRAPFSIFAYAAQADAQIGQWRVLADVSGKTGLRFDESGQFDRIETNFRIENKLSPTCTLAATAQMSDHFSRGALDFTLKPTPWLDTKGAIYWADNINKTTHTLTQGGYLYAGFRPIAEVPQLEFHSQADYQQALGRPATTPWILSAGARMQIDKGKHSATIDFQQTPGVNGRKDANALLLRFQTRF